MLNIKPISDLRNYSDVLRGVSVDAPVFLTKNGLMGELEKGRKSGEKKGWLSSSDVRARFRAKANEE